MFKEILTDPSVHDPENFIYLIHGMVDSSEIVMRYNLNMITDPGYFFSASLIGRLDSKTGKTMFGYDREISQLVTFGDIGMIIRPVDDNVIYIAWNCDLGSPVGNDELKAFAEEHKGKIRPALTLLTETKGYPSVKLNHLIVRGNEKNELQGVFYRREGSKKDAEMLIEMARDIIGYEGPLIQLPKPYSAKYDSIQDPAERISKIVSENIEIGTDREEDADGFYKDNPTVHTLTSS